jgi:hypothetical protein
MNKNQANEAILELTTAIIEEANAHIQTALDSDRRVTKAVLASEITKALEALSGCNETLVYATVTSYVDLREDLETGKGPHGGVGAKGWKPTANEADSGVLQAAEDLIQALPFGSYTTMTQVAMSAAAKTASSELRAYQVISKAWKGRTDLEFRKGPNGGVARKDPNKAVAVESEETQAQG